MISNVKNSARLMTTDEAEIKTDELLDQMKPER